MWRELQPDDPGRIGPYRIRGVLGAGGMGRVFLAMSAHGEQVAVKVIRADLASDPEFRARFRREVTVARKVSSRFTAPLIGADVDGPVPWLATAYVTGPSLAEAVAQRGPLPATSLLELAAGLAEGLSAIHAAGVIHRDLKPSNVLLAQDGPRVIDFGISVAAETSPLTRTGLLIGSPGYMSPEQVEGREVGSASDVFSLGAVLAFAATGEAPFGSGSAPTLAYRAVHRQANLDGVPAEVRGLIDRCLAKDPGRRPAARDLMLAAGAGAMPVPTERWVPEPGTPTVTALASGHGVSRTLTSARLAPVSQPAPARPGRPGRPGGPVRPGRRKQRRPLAIASVVAVILAACTAGGVAVAGCTLQTPAVHPVSSPIASAPATSAPSMAPSTSPTATASPSASASVTPTASATATPATTATATPSASGTSTASPTATATGTPTATATSTPTAITTGTAGTGSSPAPAPAAS